MTTATMTRPPRQHGTYACYGAGCRRLECRAAKANYNQIREAAARDGEPTTDLVDATPVRAHAQRLRAAGMGWRQIAVTAGVANTTIRGLLHSTRPTLRVRPETAAAILGIETPRLAAQTLVDAARTWQLIHGLIAAGYPRAWIAGQLGQTGGGLQLGDRQVHHETAVAVEQLADKHAHLPGPSTRARREAARNGWTVAALWEALDGTANDEEPADWVTVERVVAGDRPDHRLRPATRAAVIDEFVDRGLTVTEIGRRLGTSGSDIKRNLARRQPQETP